MRILNVNATLDLVSGGGTAERMRQMSRFLAKAGAECRVLTLDIGLTVERLSSLAGVQVIALKCIHPRFYLFAPHDPRILEAVRWADVVHLMGHWTLINAVVYRAARKLARPYVFCPAGGLPIFGRSQLLKAVYNNMIGCRIARGASACVAIGANEAEHFRSYGIAPERVTLIPNGVDLEDFAAADERAFRATFGIGDAPFVLFMGRLNAIKGPDLLMRAFGEISHDFPDMHLVFAGPDGGMLHRLRQTARESGIGPRVHFLGHVSGEDKTAAYRAARLLVIPSRREAMSIVVLEAGACGTPAIITNQCGFDQLERSGGGRVVPPTADGIKSALFEMLKDPQALRAMGTQLQDYVRRDFLWDSIARKYLRLFDAVLQQGTP